MSLKFRKVEQTVRFGTDAGSVKTYGRAKTSGVSSFEKMCDLISARSTVSSGDVKGVFDSLLWAMGLELRSGNVVQLGEFGNFRLSIRTEGVIEDAEKDIKFSALNIKKARLVFTPGASLKDSLSKVVFEPDDVKVVEVECEKPHAI